MTATNATKATAAADDHRSANRTYHEAQQHMELLPNYYRWTYRHIEPALGPRVIELGCGAGIGIGCYLDKVHHVLAVDYNQALLDRVKARFPGDNVTAQCLDLLDDWAALAGVDADTVVMMDVLEHFADDGDVMVKVADCLKPGGMAAIKVPAQAALFGEIDIASGHYRRYDRADLERVAHAAGFTTQAIRPINPLGALAYRFKKGEKKNFSKTFSPGQLRAINRAIPAIALLDNLRFLPGQSWVGLFRKAG